MVADAGSFPTPRHPVTIHALGSPSSALRACRGGAISVWLLFANACSDGAGRPGVLPAVDAGPLPDVVGGVRPDAPVEAPADAAIILDDPAVPSEAVAFQISPAHTGAQPDVHLTLPLARRWTRDLDGATSYAIVASGIAFVTVRNRARSGTSLYALDVNTGSTRWGPIDLNGRFWSTLTYENGRVFAVNDNALLRTFEATTGALLWSTPLPGMYACDAAPTASGGLVFVLGVGVGHTLYAFHQESGAVAWSVSGFQQRNNPHCSPTVGGGRVFVAAPCNEAFAFDAASGRSLWRHSGACERIADYNVALYAGSIHTRDEPAVVLNAATGAQTGTSFPGRMPAFAGGVGYYVPATAGTMLQAVSVGATTPRWTFTADRPLVTAPIVVGAHVVVGGRAGRLYVLSRDDGTVVATDTLPSVSGYGNYSIVGPLSAMSAAAGTLFVPMETGLTAYEARSTQDAGTPP